jgi:hypothetical protein
MTRMRLIGLVALAAAPAVLAQGQQPAPKKPTTGQAIEIRGQAPTPQVVTVRPREVPAYTPVSLPGAVMASSSWPSVTAAYSITQADQLAGRLPLDTSAAGIARGGAMVGGVIVAGAAAKPGAANAAASVGAPVAGASTAEIEAMRRELAMRKARLDSLQRALHENEARQSTLGPAPTGQRAAPRMSAADSAARADEIKAIRRELEYRLQRLDSLQREVNTLGQPRKAAPAKSDTTTKAGGKPPRGHR